MKCSAGSNDSKSWQDVSLASTSNLNEVYFLEFVGWGKVAKNALHTESYQIRSKKQGNGISLLITFNRT